MSGLMVVSATPSGPPPVPPVQAAGPPDKPARLAGRSFLIVEDDPVIALNTQYLLEDADAIVVGVAVTVSEGIRLAGERTFDAAVLDVDLQGEDVFPIADILVQRAIPFLFHTGCFFPDHMESPGLQPRFANVHVLRKPCTNRDLTAGLADLLA